MSSSAVRTFLPRHLTGAHTVWIVIRWVCAFLTRFIAFANVHSTD